MVFKMLKGFRRLMLTTGLMCSVGLFLCAVDVKASLSSKVESSSGDFTVTVTSNAVNDGTTTGLDAKQIVKVELISGGTTVYTQTGSPIENLNIATTDGTPVTTTVSISAGDFIKGEGVASKVVSGNSITVDDVKVYYNTNTDSSASTLITPPGSQTATSNPIYKPEAVNADTAFTSASPTYTVKVAGTSRDFGYATETFTVNSNVSGTDYFEAATEDTSVQPAPALSASAWKDAGTTYTIVDVTKTIYFDYFPKVSEISLNENGTEFSASSNEIFYDLADNSALIDNNFDFIIVPKANTTPNVNAIKSKGTIAASLTTPSNLESPVVSPIGTDGFRLKVGSGTGSSKKVLTNPANNGTAAIQVKCTTIGEPVNTNYNLKVSVAQGPTVTGINVVEEELILYGIDGKGTVTVKLSSTGDLTNKDYTDNITWEADSHIKDKINIAFSSTAATSAGKEIVISAKDASTRAWGDVIFYYKKGTADEKTDLLRVTVEKEIEPTVIIVPETISLIKGSKTPTVISVALGPDGADQSGLADTSKFKGVISDANKFSAEISTDGKSISLLGKELTGSKDEALELSYKVNATTTIKKTIKIKVVDSVSISSDKTKEAIKKADNNYITIGDDYKLDLVALLKDCVKNGNGDNLKIEPAVVWISSGSDYADLDSSNFKLKGKKAGTVKLCANFYSTEKNATTADIKDFEVNVYPMPTAKYVDSARTIEVTLPGKVATKYKDEKALAKVRGFKLSLQDSSGNELYAYDNSKFQSAVGEFSDTTKTYTISASDVESMVTSAASNGKFSNETTSVKFCIIPMGYKPDSTDNTVADSKINATCSTNVYRVTASGTNFGTSYAYGLDGQTVKLTASPNAGYTFKQWSDGNTSNPRDVKISGSGTRAFQAVAGERVPGANGTGTNGTDNSQLYDDVPKTAESNSAIWLIIFMVFAVMGTTYALYLQLRAASSKNDK